jgi:hypothetical protein
MVAAVVLSFSCALYARTTSAMQAVLDTNGYSLVLAEHHYNLKDELRITEKLLGPSMPSSSSGSTMIRRCLLCSTTIARPSLTVVVTFTCCWAAASARCGIIAASVASDAG